MATTMSTRDRGELTAVRRAAASPDDGRVCAECTHAQLYAVEPRALCTCGESAFFGKALIAGQSACVRMSPRADDEYILSVYAPHEMNAHIGGAQALAR